MTQERDDVQSHIERLKLKANKRFKDSSKKISNDTKHIQKDTSHLEAKNQNPERIMGATVVPEVQLNIEIADFPRQNSVPNGCLVMVPELIRSALFGVVQKGKRRYFEQKEIGAFGNTTILFTGQALDQADCDVFMKAIALSKKGLGSKVYFSRRSFLKEIGRHTGKKDHEWLKRSLDRLRACAIRIKNKRFEYSGGLIDSWATVESTGESFVIFNPSISEALKLQTYIPLKERLSLGRSELAKWFHSYILSQSASKDRPHKVSLVQLQEICGSVSSIYDFKKTLNKSVKKIQEVSPNLLEFCRVESKFVIFAKTNVKTHGIAPPNPRDSTPKPTG